MDALKLVFYFLLFIAALYGIFYTVNTTDHSFVESILNFSGFVREKKALLEHEIKKDNQQAAKAIPQFPLETKSTSSFSSFKKLPANYSNPEALSDPHGIHGNNYSLYDINSPSGSMGKF